MEFLAFLKEYIAVSIWLIGIIAFIASIVAIYKNIYVIKDMIDKVCIILKKILNTYRTYRRKKYNRIVSSEEYLEWQNKTLFAIYDPIINLYNSLENNIKSKTTCEKAVMLINNKNLYNYESIYFKIDENNYPYPFNGITNKDDLIKCQILKTKFGNEKIIKFKFDNREQKRFYNLVKPTIHFPNNIGYALNNLSFNKGFYFTAKVCSYKMNVCTSNIMEYELYKLYLKEKRSKKTIDNKLKVLKARNTIHENFSGELNKIFTSGDFRSSLLGVQAMVFCKNIYTNTYDVLRIRRSEKVDAKAGFLQFVPSGGFSALNNSCDYDTQYSEFSVAKAILRELLEECFGEEDFSGRKLNSTENIYSNNIVKKLLKSEDLKFNFIGTAFNLVNLRHELSFLLVIENQEIIDLIRENEESLNVIQFVSVENMEKESFWTYSFDKKSDDDVKDYKFLNPTSAALWNMVQKTKFYQDLKLNNYRIIKEE